MFNRQTLLIAVLCSLLFSGSAIALNVNNTPEGGYLLCANTKSGTVTYTGKLTCPNGSKRLEIGAQGMPGIDGVDGIDGRDGLDGKNGSSFSNTLFGYRVADKDIAGTAGATKFSDLKKTIMAVIGPENLSGGSNYELAVDLEGIWATQTSYNTYISCYFQDASEYPNGARAFGGAAATYNSWTGIYLHITGHPSDYSLSKSKLYLVCATNGVISGLGGYMYAHTVSNYKGMALSSNPGI